MTISEMILLIHQVHGFTCGVNDLLVVKSADKERASKLTRSENIGKIVYSQFLGRDYGDLGQLIHYNYFHFLLDELM